MKESDEGGGGPAFKLLSDVICECVGLVLNDIVLAYSSCCSRYSNTSFPWIHLILGKPPIYSRTLYLHPWTSIYSRILYLHPWTSNIFQNPLPPSLDLLFIPDPSISILGPPIYSRILYLHPWTSNIFKNPLPPFLDLQYILEPSTSILGPPIYSRILYLYP